MPGAVDYNPALVALHDLATWAFDLVEDNVVDWPEGLRRLHGARRYVRAQMRGRSVRRASIDDVLFTAGLLARILGEDRGFDLSEVILILDALGLPTEVVPIVPRGAPSTHAARPAPTPITSLRPRSAAAVAVAPSPCAQCGHVHPLEHPFRNAA